MNCVNKDMGATRTTKDECHARQNKLDEDRLCCSDPTTKWEHLEEHEEEEEDFLWGYFPNYNLGHMSSICLQLARSRITIFVTRFFLPATSGDLFSPKKTAARKLKVTLSGDELLSDFTP